VLRVRDWYVIGHGFSGRKATRATLGAVSAASVVDFCCERSRVRSTFA
jgi:hypothetical protein